MLFFLPLFVFAQGFQPPMDRSYGFDGMVKRSYVSNEQSIAFAGLPLENGSMLVAGDYNGEIALTKLKADGNPDSGFAVNGYFGYVKFSNSTVLALATDSANRILIAGRAGNSLHVFSYIIRLHSNGKIDTTWAQSGIWTSKGDDNEEITALVVTERQRIIACANRQTDTSNFRGIVRFFSESGQIDSSANTFGTVAYGDNSFFMNMYRGRKGLYLLGAEGNTVYKPVIVKIDENGFADSAFGVNGKAVFNQEIEGVLYSISEDNHGFLIGAGEKRVSAFRKNGFLVKLKPNGLMDNSFGVLGNVNFSGGKYGNGVRIITPGANNTFFITGYTVLSSVRHTVFMTHYDSAANPISDFGTSGSWEYKTDSSMSVWDAKPDPTQAGRLYLIGTSSVSTGSSGKYFVIRMNLDSRLKINEPSAISKHLLIHPNPVARQQKVVVDIPESGNLMITDFTGKIFYNRQVLKGVVELPHEIAGKSGAYIVALQANNNMRSSVLVIE